MKRSIRITPVASGDMVPGREYLIVHRANRVVPVRGAVYVGPAADRRHALFVNVSSRDTPWPQRLGGQREYLRQAFRFYEVEE